MSRKVELNLDAEIEIQATVTPGERGRRAHRYDQIDPDYPATVEDVYVGVIIKGTAIDITALLNPKQLRGIEEECLLAAIDAENGEQDAADDARFESMRDDARERASNE